MIHRLHPSSAPLRHTASRYHARMSGTDGSDHALGLRLQRGDDAVLAEVLRRYGPHVAGLLRRTFHWLGTEDINDVLAEAVFKLWMNRTRFDPARGSLKTYFYVIARSAAVDLTKLSWFQASLTQRPLDDQDPPAPAGTDHDHYSPLRQEVLQLRQILRQWDEIDRVILLASTQEGHWAKDLARQLGMTAGAVRVRRHRLVAKLREEMDRTSTPS